MEVLVEWVSNGKMCDDYIWESLCEGCLVKAKCLSRGYNMKIKPNDEKRPIVFRTGTRVYVRKCCLRLLKKLQEFPEDIQSKLRVEFKHNGYGYRRLVINVKRDNSQKGHNCYWVCPKCGQCNGDTLFDNIIADRICPYCNRILAILLVE